MNTNYVYRKRNRGQSFFIAGCHREVAMLRMSIWKRRKSLFELESKYISYLLYTKGRRIEVYTQDGEGLKLVGLVSSES